MTASTHPITRHDFQEILVIAVCAMLSDADSFEDSALRGRLKADWLRRSADGDASPVHMVSAFSTQLGLVLGQKNVAGKRNEITAIPEMLDTTQGLVYHELAGEDRCDGLAA